MPLSNMNDQAHQGETLGHVDIAGRLTVKVDYADGYIKDLQITSSRPQGLTGLFIGKSPQTVCQLHPLLFSLCRNAQLIAGLSVFESLQAVTVPQPALIARNVLVYLETAQELCLRLSSDWLDDLQVIDLAQLMTTIKQAYGALSWCLGLHTSSQPVVEAGFDYESILRVLDQVLQPLSQFCTHYLLNQRTSGPIPQLVSHLNQTFAPIKLGHPASPLQLSAESLIERLQGADSRTFCAQPDLYVEGQWQPVETSVWTRNCNLSLVKQGRALGAHPLTLRVLAVINELESIPDKIRRVIREQNHLLITQLAPGLIKVQAARGDLVHRVELSHDVATKVKQYQIIAPTEWNFHPQGSLVSMLKGVIVPKERLMLLLEKMILAIDPCVAYDIQIEE